MAKQTSRQKFCLGCSCLIFDIRTQRIVLLMGGCKRAKALAGIDANKKPAGSLRRVFRTGNFQ
ncbi:hypothetical protein, partial [Roseibium sp.]|uniref:hypothetical protein n=1 Tax=Roseibium sp. TaxID=1936156 RepID=UPI0025E91773